MISQSDEECTLICAIYAVIQRVGLHGDAVSEAKIVKEFDLVEGKNALKRHLDTTFPGTSLGQLLAANQDRFIYSGEGKWRPVENAYSQDILDVMRASDKKKLGVAGKPYNLQEMAHPNDPDVICALHAVLMRVGRVRNGITEDKIEKEFNIVEGENSLKYYLNTHFPGTSLNQLLAANKDRFISCGEGKWKPVQKAYNKDVLDVMKATEEKKLGVAGKPMKV